MNNSTNNSPSLATVALVTLGTLVAVLGLFAAGDIGMVALGMAAVAMAGIIESFNRRSDRNGRS